MTDDAGLSDVKTLLGECDGILRNTEMNTPRGPKREYLTGARNNTMRAFRDVAKAMECEDATTTQSSA